MQSGQTVVLGQVLEVLHHGLALADIGGERDVKFATLDRHAANPDRHGERRVVLVPPEEFALASDQLVQFIAQEMIEIALAAFAPIGANQDRQRFAEQFCLGPTE